MTLELRLMKGNKAAALVILLSTILAGTYAALRAGSSTTFATPPPETLLTNTFTDTPTPTPGYEGCAYMWAYQDLPEISAQLDQAIKEIIPEASAHATAFGEDCVYADGRRVFGAMETDIYVTLPVDDLNDTEALGDQVAGIMTVILQRFPPGSVPGGTDGFVEFRFEASDGGSTILRVAISRYRHEAQGMTGSELFLFFQNNP